jgi:hypothetical protein
MNAQIVFDFNDPVNRVMLKVEEALGLNVTCTEILHEVAETTISFPMSECMSFTPICYLLLTI